MSKDSNEVFDNYTSEYVTTEEATKLLKMDKLDDGITRKCLQTLNIRSIKRDRRLFFNLQDIYKVLSEAMEFFDSHYTYNELMQIKGVTRGKIENSKLIKVQIPFGFNPLLSNIRFPKGDYKQSKSAYKKKEVNDILHKLTRVDNKQYSTEGMSEEDINKYLSLNDTSVKLGMDGVPKWAIKGSIQAFDFRQIIKNRKKYYHIDDINAVIENVRTFFENHYTYDEVIGLSNISSAALYSSGITKVRIPNGYNAVHYCERNPNLEYRKNKVAYKKEDIDRFLDLYVKSKIVNKYDDAESTISDYEPLEQVLMRTRFSRLHFIKVIKNHYRIRTISIYRKLYYHIEDINKIIYLQNKFLSDHIDRKSAKKLFSIDKKFNIESLPVIQAPIYAITKDNTASITGTKGVYRISDIKELIEKKQIQRINNDMEGATPFETFNIRLNSISTWKGFEKDSTYTENKWFKYVKDYLVRSTSNEKTRMSEINKFIRGTFNIFEILQRYSKAEVYLLTANEINLFLRGICNLTNKKLIYRFIKYVYADVINNNDLKIRCFKLAEIEIPPRKLLRNDDNAKNNSTEVIYDFVVYSEVFKYTLDVALHVMKSLEEICLRESCTYASTWLYVMLHLNNAWRHGDVRDFPKLEIDDLLSNVNIVDLSWFKENVIELDLARAIIQRVRQWEIIISKNQMKGRFFCSDELAPAVATAIIILNLFDKKLPVNSSKYLMKFDTKFNEVSESMLKEFFRELNIKDFKFTSRKFNKSIMTYITYLANISGDAKSIEYAKWMRSHKRISSTLHYIDFDIQSVEEISRMLFARGEFGYVVSLLLNRLNQSSHEDFKAITEQVNDINLKFGEIYKINNTIAFMNTIRTNREEVTQYLSTKSLEECQELLTEIYTMKLPSKIGTDIQCLFSKVGCKRTDLNDCFECTYHIPTIYALTTMGKKIMNDIIEYNSSVNLPKKYRLAIKIHHKKKVVIEAIQKFGIDYVYSCIGVSREEFLDQLSLVEPIKL